MERFRLGQPHRSDTARCCQWQVGRYEDRSIAESAPGRFRSRRCIAGIETNSYCVYEARRLGVRKPTWATSFSARYSTAPHQACRSTRRPRENRVAYVPAFLFHFVTQYGSRHQGATRVAAALYCAKHDERLYAGGVGTEKGCKQRSCRSAFWEDIF